MRRLLLATVVWSLTVPAVAAAAPPVITTGPPTAVGKTSATATGTVDPEGLATTVRVEYGETPEYGLATTEILAGDGADPVPIAARLEGLTPGTTYHYRIVAANADGTARSGDLRLSTAAATSAAIPPAAATKPARDAQPTAATLTGRVNPKGLPTRYAFEYGPTQALGARTPEVAAGSARGTITVERTLTRLQPATRYFFRIVATNAAGTTLGATRSFVTTRGLTSIVLRLPAPVLTWGSSTSVRGQVLGGGVGGIPVALERQDHPFRAAFRAVRERKTAPDGSFFLPVDRVRGPVRLRVVTRTSSPATSPVATIGSRLLVVVSGTRVGARRFAITGTVRPGVGRGRVVVQRQVGRRWVTLGRPKVRRVKATRSRLRFTLRRRSRAMRVRVVAAHSNARTYQRGESRVLRVPAAARR